MLGFSGVDLVLRVCVECWILGFGFGFMLGVMDFVLGVCFVDLGRGFLFGLSEVAWLLYVLFCLSC